MTNAWNPARWRSINLKLVVGAIVLSVKEGKISTSYATLNRAMLVFSPFINKVAFVENHMIYKFLQQS